MVAVYIVYLISLPELSCSARRSNELISLPLASAMEYPPDWASLSHAPCIPRRACHDCACSSKEQQSPFSTAVGTYEAAAAKFSCSCTLLCTHLPTRRHTCCCHVPFAFGLRVESMRARRSSQSASLTTAPHQHVCAACIGLRLGQQHCLSRRGLERGADACLPARVTTCKVGIFEKG